MSLAFRFLTAGESHGEALVAVIDGVPAGLPLTEAEINEDLARRQRGYGRGGRMKIERDRVHLTSGVRWGLTLGSPITLTIPNLDWENWKATMSVGPPEPGAAAPMMASREVMLTPSPSIAATTTAINSSVFSSVPRNLTSMASMLARSITRMTKRVKSEPSILPTISIPSAMKILIDHGKTQVSTKVMLLSMYCSRLDSARIIANVEEGGKLAYNARLLLRHPSR